MCLLCNALRPAPSSPWSARRAFVLASGAALAGPAWAQIDVGPPSSLRTLIPAEALESAAAEQYHELLAQARAKRALAPDNHPQLLRLRAIARRLIPFAPQWNPRAAQWRWEVNLIGSKQINAFCMPGGKIAFFTGILEQLRLTDDEAAMVMGHEMAHALREHARAQLAKTRATSLGLTLGAQLLGLGELGNTVADLGTRLLALKFSRADETEADLVGLELGARAGYDPHAAVTLWQKMNQVAAGAGLEFLSTHPSGPERIQTLEQNVPRVEGLYLAARSGALAPER
ncbi:M48 family metallopeptidase [Extensimonas vulgaris]|uniref:Peptidase M48-like protein n=1 Tax=Extensimonas vulgaris TaxID=1031594 RepID=A0A369AIJ4_9BURK|nr:M48 family metallopeptidase [Extensimonas vulgaris]RCX09199.1 peptidase M48-like protein [Extensimonas vulgaris]TWI37782.1 peptidase M48-like protein [Extensimonas vulgaris]TXD15906.1 M48 family metallopeptidase [Extensimonas vulgaris]